MAWFEDRGSRIYYEDEGHGSPVLFLPGWSESVDEFRDLREALLARWRVISADLPGSGKSGPQPRTYATTYYQNDAESFLAMLEHLQTGPAHVVGFSDGGEIGIVMAARPAAVRSLVAWGAAGRLETPPALLDAFYNLTDSPPGELKRFSDHLKQVYGEENARMMAQNVATAWRRMVAAGGDIGRNGAPGIRCPVLLITGDGDPFASPAVVSELAGAIPRGEFIEVKGGGHDLQKSHGAWLAQTIVDFVARHDG